MTTELNPAKITRLLNQGTRHLDEQILSSLQQARAQALQRQTASAPILSFAGHRWSSLLIPHTAQQWLAAGLLALVLVGGGSLWLQHQREQQINDLDVSILTDELPIELFID